MPDLHPEVQGRCPACRGESLFLGSGGYVTCSRIDCPDPDAASRRLEQPDEIDLAEPSARSNETIAQLRAAVARVRALHVPSSRLYSGVPACEGCAGDDPWTTPGYPCPTIAALEPPKGQP